MVASVGAFTGNKIVNAIDRPWNTSVSKMQVGDMTRSYTTISPKSGLAADAPIILVLSGIYAGQNQEINRDQFTSYVKAGKAELVYPLAYRETWNAVGCCSWAANAAVNDLGFIEALVPKVDPGHTHPIYVMGYSNGGRLAYRIACTNPTLFDGYAMVKADPIPGCEVLDEMKIMQIASPGRQPGTVPAQRKGPGIARRHRPDRAAARDGRVLDEVGHGEVGKPDLHRVAGLHEGLARRVRGVHDGQAPLPETAEQQAGRVAGDLGLLHQHEARGAAEVVTG